METRSNHILVGGVVLALVVALVGFIIWLSQVSGESRKEYDVFFNQAVDGLAKGSAVTFSGVPVGQIESINLEPQQSAIRPGPHRRAATTRRSCRARPRPSAASASPAFRRSSSIAGPRGVAADRPRSAGPMACR